MNEQEDTVDPSTIKKLVILNLLYLNTNKCDKN